jgi:hypothetical protein
MGVRTVTPRLIARGPPGFFYRAHGAEDVENASRIVMCEHLQGCLRRADRIAHSSSGIGSKS